MFLIDLPRCHSGVPIASRFTLKVHPEGRGIRRGGFRVYNETLYFSQPQIKWFLQNESLVYLLICSNPVNRLTHEKDQKKKACFTKRIM